MITVLEPAHELPAGEVAAQVHITTTTARSETLCYAVIGADWHEAPIPWAVHNRHGFALCEDCCVWVRPDSEKAERLGLM